MELRHIKYFLVLAQELNFSKAAEKLCITQGTLSQQIKQLEFAIGAELFERSSRNVILTEAGEELFPIAQKTMDAAIECSQVAIDLRNASIGHLNIGLTHSFKPLLNNTVKQFIKEYPGIKLNLCYSTARELLKMLRDHKVDFFVAWKPYVEFKDLESTELFDSQLCVIMRRGHPMSSSPSISIEELRRHPLALPSPGLQARKMIEQFINTTEGGFNVAVETNDPNILIEIVSTTNLLSITSNLAISYHDNLVFVPLHGIDVMMTACIHRLKGAYVKHSASIFSKMLIESADLEKIVF